MNKDLQFAVLCALAHTEGKIAPDILTRLDSKSPKIDVVSLVEDYLYPMKDLGFLTKLGEFWLLSLDGYAAMNLLRSSAEVKISQPSVATGQSPPPKDTLSTRYLQMRVNRQGAYDAFKCPSKQGTKTVPFKS